jgi:hypothetical protein
METLLFQIIFGEPSLAHELNRSLPVEVGEVLKKGLAKKPEDRFATCREFVDALMKACDANPNWAPAAPGAVSAASVTTVTTVTIPPPPLPRAEASVAIRPPWWSVHTGALVSVVVVAALAVATFAYWKNRPARLPPVSEVREQQVRAVPVKEPEAPPAEAPKPKAPPPKESTVTELKKTVPPAPAPKVEPSPPKPAPQETVAPPPAAPKETPRRRVVVPLDRFTGALEGTLTCTGEFAASSTVAIDDSQGCSGKLPEVAAELTVKVSPADVTVVESPAAANQYQRLVLRMPNRRVSSVTIRWEIK